jgi:hypothetical protein
MVLMNVSLIITRCYDQQSNANHHLELGALYMQSFAVLVHNCQLERKENSGERHLK